MTLHSRAAIAALLLSCGTLPATAHTTPAAKRPDPGDAQAAVPPMRYRSALTRTPPPAEVPVGSWTNANQAVGLVGGWRAYAREASPSATTPASAAAPGGARR